MCAGELFGVVLQSIGSMEDNPVDGGSPLILVDNVVKTGSLTTFMSDTSEFIIGPDEGCTKLSLLPVVTLEQTSANA
jgi:hypothetical protein